MEIESKSLFYEDENSVDETSVDEFGRTPNMISDPSEEVYKIFVSDSKEPLYITRKLCYFLYRLRLPLAFADKDDTGYPVFKELP